ncbi:MAG: restriction endonuclease subunit S [Clostridia bacterium]
MRDGKMRAKLEDFLQEVCEKTITNNQYPVLTSSKSGLFLQSDYFNKQVASKDNTGYKIIRRGQFTYRAMSDTGKFFPNMLECADVGIVSPAYPVFEIIKQDQIVPEYLNYYFKSNRFQNSISTFAQGSTRTSVKFGKLKKVSIELPEIKKQYQIIRTLDLLRTIINNRKKEVLELDELIRARFVEMFGNGHDGFCNTKKLGEFCKFQQGTQIPVEEQIEEQLEGYTRFLRIIDYTQAPQIPRYVSVKSREIAEDSIVIVRYGATAGFVGHGYAGILANNLFEVVPDESILSKDFLYLALKYGTFEQEVHDKAFGAAMPALSFGMMNDIGVVTPNSTAQNGFVDFVKQVDKSKATVQKALDETQLLFDSLMQQYFG